MYCIDYIRHFVTDQSITLYWDKPNRAPKDTVYRVLLDGELISETSKTHFTIENLNDNQVYDVKVEVAVDGMIASGIEYGAICTAKKKQKKTLPCPHTMLLAMG